MARSDRGLAVELAESAYVVEGNGRLPHPLVVSVHRLHMSQVEDGPKQHRGVSVREHESVAIWPNRILGIETHDTIPNGINQRRERHRRAGVPGLSLLYRIYREGTNGVDR